MTAWDPAAYEEFREHRHQPFMDLMSAVPTIEPRFVVDAGCGTGRTTQELARRYPNARITGVDQSCEMLAKAKDFEYVQADVATWQPPEDIDLVVSNAVLHWVWHPQAVVAHLASWLAPGGVLAIQVPANHDAPSHRITYDEAEKHGLGDVARGDHILSLDGYRRALPGFDVKSWDHEYHMELRGEEAVYRWLLGTTLRPYIGQPHTDAFLAAVRGRLRSEYPAGAVTKFTFKRRFVIAKNENKA